MKKLRLLKRRVLIQRTPYQPFEQTRSGLWLPASAREKPQTGTVLATTKNSDLDVGTTVLISKYSDRQLSIDNTDCELLPEAECIAEIRK